ncbi:hypothetical protein [Pseudomonas panipatensis]|uniref:hypothetical protein n=1 Tax=Pseudomonas panipatensis TaxID=428992 RepID=UPI0035AFCBDA
MKIRTSVLLLLLTLCVPPLASFAADTHGSADSAQSQALTTRLALRDLWLEHIFWIRNYAQANQAGDSRQAAVASEQVVSNATTIANSLAPLYGQPAADQLLKLLAGHWGAVKHYSDASVAKSAAGRKAAISELTSNAAALAKFLAAANPYLPENDLLAMLGTHGAQHIAQIDQLAAHDYAAEAKTWQAMRAHILMLADTLGAALVKQFPDKF